jgi:hypothetical protein
VPATHDRVFKARGERPRVEHGALTDPGVARSRPEEYESRQTS